MYQLICNRVRAREGDCVIEQGRPAAPTCWPSSDDWVNPGSPLGLPLTPPNPLPPEGYPDRMKAAAESELGFTSGQPETPRG